MSSHPLEPVARSLCLPTEAAVSTERERLSALVVRLHPLKGRWTRVAYTCGLLWPFAWALWCADSLTSAALYAAINLVALALALHLATRKNSRELFLLEPLPASVGLHDVARGSPRANAFVARLKRNRASELVVDLLAVRAYR